MSACALNNFQQLKNLEKVMSSLIDELKSQLGVLAFNDGAQIIVLITPPFTPTITVGVGLSRASQLPYVHSGCVLRAELRKRPPMLGQNARDAVMQHQPIPSGLMFGLLYRDLVGLNPQRGTILDRFPWCPDQAKLLEELARVTMAFHFKVSDEELIERARTQRVCLNIRCGRRYGFGFEQPRDEGICNECRAFLIRRTWVGPQPEELLVDFRAREQRIVEFYAALEVLHSVPAGNDASVVDVCTSIGEVMIARAPGLIVCPASTASDTSAAP
jgi:adenylate kinase